VSSGVGDGRGMIASVSRGIGGDDEMIRERRTGRKWRAAASGALPQTPSPSTGSPMRQPAAAVSSNASAGHRALSACPLSAAPPPRARAVVDRLDRVSAEPDLVLTAEEVEQHAHPLCAVHARAQPEVIAEGITQDAHARSGPQPAKLDCAVALTGGYRRSRRRARRPAHAPLLTMPHSPRL
jgi:hypothetical protein